MSMALNICDNYLVMDVNQAPQRQNPPTYEGWDQGT